MTRRRATSLVIVKASEKGDAKSEDTTTPEFNPFGFVTDNPSSRSAIQLPASPAEDGNVGQMLYVKSFPNHSLIVLLKIGVCFANMDFCTGDELSNVRFET